VGAAYVYDLTSATPATPVSTLVNPQPTFLDHFGTSVDISGTRVVVGAPQSDTGAVESGQAFLYDLSSSTPGIAIGILNNPTPAKDDNFGWAVAIDGLTVAVSCIAEEGTALDRGAAYVFGPASNDTNGNGLLDLWEYARFGSLTGRGAADDTDGDGLSELMELAFDKDPLSREPKVGPAPVLEGGYLTLTITKRAGVDYLVQSGPSALEADFSAETTTVLTDNATTLKVRDNFPMSAIPLGTTAGRLMRVRVASAP
jgi:hypothetical protein